MSKNALFRTFAAVLGVPILLVVVFFGYLYNSQESIIFAGTTLPRDHKFDFEIPFKEVTIPVGDAEINALHFEQANPRGLIFFLHGNGGNLDSWTANVDYYRRVNYDLFIFDYRGYGKSTGQIQSEEQLHNDVRAAWNTVAEQYQEKPIVIYGRSLGAALAARLASDVDSTLLILVSPFSSMVAMARMQYPLLPEWLVRYPLRTDNLIANIRTPTVLVHGDEDRLIPLTHSLQLKELATSKSKLLVIRGAGHNDIHNFRSYLDGLTRELPN
ncbi:MAG: lysophospholipase [Gammaproteobacteria bacterium]|nr:lysophospholipase [Gammaproteobacteria bacterium]